MEEELHSLIKSANPSHITSLVLDNKRMSGTASEFSTLGKFTNVETLSMVDVGCTSLQGFPYLPKLRKLFLADNRITTLQPLVEAKLHNLTNLDLSNNRIGAPDTLKPLVQLPNLKHLLLYETPLWKHDNYQDIVFNLLKKTLITLDGSDKNGNEVDVEESESEDAEDDEEDADELTPSKTSRVPISLQKGSTTYDEDDDDEDDDNEDDDEGDDDDDEEEDVDEENEGDEDEEGEDNQHPSAGGKSVPNNPISSEVDDEFDIEDDEDDEEEDDEDEEDDEEDEEEDDDEEYDEEEVEEVGLEYLYRDQLGKDDDLDDEFEPGNLQPSYQHVKQPSPSFQTSSDNSKRKRDDEPDPTFDSNALDEFLVNDDSEESSKRQKI